MLLLGAAGAVHGQSYNLRFRHLTIDDGLSQSTLYAIVQDRQGFMWFGTQEGLNRFDGHHFVAYKHHLPDSTSLSGNEVRTLYEDAEGRLWVGTYGAGLNRLDDAASGRFTAFRHDAADPGSLRDDRVRVLAGGHGGRLWVGTESGLDRFDPATGRFAHVGPGDASHDPVMALLEDPDGTLWVGREGRLERRDGSETTVFRHDPEDPGSLSPGGVWALLRDHDGVLWVGTDNGLDRFDPATGHFVHYRHDPVDPHSLSHNSIWALMEDRGGTLWVGTYGGGLNRLTPERDRFIRYLHNPADPTSPSGNRVHTLYEDRSGVLWVGTTDADGLDYTGRKTERFGWHHHRTDDPHSLSPGSVWAFAEAADGRVWVGTDTGLDRFDPATGLSEHFRHDAADPGSLRDDRVWALTTGPGDILWVGTDRGLDRRDPATGRFDPVPAIRNPTGGIVRVWALALAPDGTLWAGTDGHGLFHYDPATGRTRTYHTTNGLGEDRIRTLFFDHTGRLWVGTYAAGLNRFDPQTERFVLHRHRPRDPNSLSSDRIRALYEDAGGALWVGTDGGGLNRLEHPEAPTFTRFTEPNLPNNTVYAILPGAGGRLWLSTNRGLVVFDPGAGTVAAYTVHNGLQSNEFNGGAALRSRTGRLFFGGINGFNAFDPAGLRPNTIPPPVHFTGFRKFNRETPLPPDGILHLDYTDVVLSYEFAALDFHTPSENHYAYRLEGFNDTWVDLGPKRDVTFTNLDPGTYTLHVRGSNSDGVWNEEGARLTLIVHPPFWQRGWVQVLGLGLLATLLWAGHRVRTTRIERHNRLLRNEIAERRRAEQERQRFVEELEARNAELERFTYTVSHDLKSPLFTIKGFLGMLQHDAETGNHEQMRRDIHHITVAADRMGQMLQELLELSRAGHVASAFEPVPLRTLLPDVLAQFNGELTDRGIVVDLPTDPPDVYGDPTRLREVWQNLIENALKFLGDQPHPRITVEAAAHDDAVLCRVIDNGRGIDPQYHDKIFGLFERLDTGTEGTGVGLALVKRIIETHGGRIWVESDGVGHGSTFVFTLPAPPAASA